MRALCLLPLLAPAACAMTPPSGGAPTAERYRAVGTEPFWSVTIADGRMRYAAPGEAPVEVAAPAPRSTASGTRYAAPGLILETSPGPCSDGMSDRSYRDTVSARVGERALNGCGGPLDDAATLVGGEWRIAAIDGAALPADPPATLSFTDDRLSGSVGCNRMTGGYALVDGKLVAGGIATTRMMCPPPLMQREMRLLDLLREPLSARRGEDDAVTLTAPDGGTITLNRAAP